MITALVLLFGINILITVVFVIAGMKTLCFDNLEECRTAFVEMIKEQSIFECLSEDEICGALILLALFGKIAILILSVLTAVSVKRRTDKDEEA